jgi:abortive infection bacteriophage resistance protein
MANFRAYTKPPADTPTVLAKLQAQGLTISDAANATRTIDRVGYFRFRGYLYPYFDLAAVLPPMPRKFKVGATFEQALDMYRFDEGLRRLIFNLITELEVTLRTTLDSTMSHTAGHGFWYLQPEWFKNGGHPSRVIGSLSSSFCASSENYAQHYHLTYFNEQSGKYKHLPPFWIICELSTIGQLRDFFEGLKEDASPPFPSATLPKNTVLDKMAKRLGASDFRGLAKWVHVLRDVRNACAHHGRLWNRNLIAPPSVGNKVSKPFPLLPNGRQAKTNTVYAALVMMRVICKSQGINDQIQASLLSLFSLYPEAQNHLYAMGMPTDWDKDNIWL